MSKNTCPCGSSKTYEKCCGAFIEANDYAKTPEQLMRSRYVAYSQGKADYIANTMRGKAAEGFLPERVKEWAKQCRWLPLKIISSKEDKDKGWVEFFTGYEVGGCAEYIHEKSDFLKIEERWYYVDGKTVKPSRNEPCPCGSEKKFKKCCGGK